MKEEWFDLVDENGVVIGAAPRSVCHGHPGLMHRAVHVIVFHRDGRLFLQKRSARKDVQPGKWDTSVGGHLQPGEPPEAGARREMREELGVDPGFLIPISQYIWRSAIESERIASFATWHDGPFQLEPTEIDEGRFWPVEVIEAGLYDGVFTEQFTQEFPRIRAWIQSGAADRRDGKGANIQPGQST